MTDIDATTILRNLPEAFWDIDVWSKDNEDHKGNFSADCADRRRIVEKVLGMVWANERNASSELMGEQ